MIGYAVREGTRTNISLDRGALLSPSAQFRDGDYDWAIDRTYKTCLMLFARCCENIRPEQFLETNQCLEVGHMIDGLAEYTIASKIAACVC